MLTREQIDLVRDSAECLAEANVAATNAFYANLFAAAPEVRTLFPEDMYSQSEKLWSSIVKVIENIEAPDEIQIELRSLGARHVGYGAATAHYAIVSEILVETISNLMKDKWSDAHRSAWENALETVCSTMLEGASRSVQKSNSR